MYAKKRFRIIVTVLVFGAVVTAMGAGLPAHATDLRGPHPGAGLRSGFSPHQNFQNESDYQVALNRQLPPSIAPAQVVGVMADSCGPEFVWEGTLDSMGFGFRLQNVGDFNGDGFDELWVSATGYFSRPYGYGYVYSGSDRSLLFYVVSELDAGSFWAAAGADINNDGYDDLIMGDAIYSGIHYRAGRVYIFHGGPGPFAGVRDAATADLTIEGDSASMFGRGIAALGDVDGDSYEDFAVGAPEVPQGNPGYALVFSGQHLDTLYTFSGETNDDGFGFFLANAGDVDGDSISDLLVSAPQFNANATGSGQAYVYSSRDGQLLFHINGEFLGDRLGFLATKSAGDLNQDGYDDFILGSAMNNVGGARAGRAYVFMGGPGPFPVIANAASADYVITGAPQNALGFDVGGIDDINGDGYPDFVVGGTYFGRNLAGYIYVMSGFDGSYLLTLAGRHPYENFGYSCAALWDLDQDGIEDLVIGAPGEAELYYHTGTARGSVYGYCIGDLDGDQITAQCDNCQRYATPENEFVNTGDVDLSTQITSADIIWLVNYVFKSGVAPMPIAEAGDVNHDQIVRSDDIIYMVNYVFKSGPPPLDACAW